MELAFQYKKNAYPFVQVSCFNINYYLNFRLAVFCEVFSPKNKFCFAKFCRYQKNAIFGHFSQYFLTTTLNFTEKKYRIPLPQTSLIQNTYKKNFF